MNDKIKSLVTAVVGLLLLSTLIMSFMGYIIPAPLWIATLVAMVGAFTWYVIVQNMFVYVCKRIVGAGTVILIIATCTFLLLRIIPGGPFDSEKALPPEVKANIEAKYNLNAPLHQQYTDYIIGLVQGDLGESYKYIGRGVSEIISEAFPISFQLGIYALFIAFLIGIPIGVFAASNHNKLADNAAMFVAISGVSLPSFLIAPILIWIFCIWLDLLPTAFWDGPEYYILPSFILGVRPASFIARIVRSSVLDVIRSDYIRTAKSKGLAHKIILYKHVLKNSLIPVLSVSGSLVANVLSGSFVIELIFAIPGMGKHLIQSVSNRDYPLILGVTLLYAAMLVIGNLIVDLMYSYFDPRMKLT